MSMSTLQLMEQIVVKVEEMARDDVLPIATNQPAGRPPKDGGLISHFEKAGVSTSRLVCGLICCIESKWIAGTYRWENPHGLTVTVYGPTAEGLKRA